MLTWMPAHTTIASFQLRKRSDGLLLTHIDHRANALADGLAKLAAVSQRVPRHITVLFDSAEALTEYAQATIGVTCKAANNARMLTGLLDSNGLPAYAIRRDSIPMAQLCRKAANIKQKAAAKARRQATLAKRALDRVEAAARRASAKRARDEKARKEEAAVAKHRSILYENRQARAPTRVSVRDPVKVAATTRFRMRDVQR